MLRVPCTICGGSGRNSVEGVCSTCGGLGLVDYGPPVVVGPVRGPSKAAIRAIVGGGLLLFLATRLRLESQLADAHRTILYVLVFALGAVQVNLSDEIMVGYFTTVGLCILLALLASSWASWPWLAWAGIWIGLSVGISAVFHRYPKAYKATVGIFIFLLFVLFILVGIDMWTATRR